MTVEVTYIGHLGNNLFEYALGRILAEELDLELQCLPATDTPGWSKVEKASGIVDRLDGCFGRFADVPQHMPGRSIRHPQIRYVVGEKPHWNGSGINLDYLLKHSRDHRIVLKGLFQRIEYYHPWRDRIRRWYRLDGGSAVPAPRPRDVIVHLRQSLDMLVLDRAIDLGFYRDLIGGMTFDRVLVCGLGIDERVRAAFAPFNPVYVDLPAIETLELITRANRIVLANSTFSWWGAYLSEASEIYFPRLARSYWGKDRTDVNLEVPEERYHYIDDVPVFVWHPFRLREHSRVALGTGRTGGPCIVFGSPPRRFAFDIPPELTAFVQWLATLGTTPFGMHEVFTNDLSQFIRPVAMGVLLVLHQHDALEAEPDGIRSLARHYGLRVDQD